MSNTRPAPSACHVDLWRVDLSRWSDLGATCEALLPPQDLNQAEAFRFPLGRERFILGRAMMRAVLGEAVGLAPGDVAFEYSGHGKPRLAGDSPVRFNLSHSGDLIVLAVTRDADIGVDVEAFRPLPRRDQIARGILSTEELSRYEALPDAERHKAFFTIWTRKEAIVKAVGRGLNFPLAEVEVCFTSKARVLRYGGCVDADIPWSLCPIDCPSGYVGALATSRPATEVTFRTWKADG